MSEVNQKTLGRVLQVEGAADTEDSMFPMRGSQVPSLVGEPRFHMLFSTPEEREMGCSRSRGGGREFQIKEMESHV